MIPSLLLKLLPYAIVAAIAGMAGYAVSDTISGRKIARLERDYANERTKAAEATAAAQEDARRIEKGWRNHVSAREAEYSVGIAFRDDRIRALDVAGVGLRKRVADFTKPGSAPGDTGSTCGNVQNRLETIGTLLGEVDDLAGESAKVADTISDELRLCRGYAEGLTKR
jgi:hypothetical protein